jgi:glycosyltransferase involved in cell wall biosynthesis
MYGNTSIMNILFIAQDVTLLDGIGGEVTHVKELVSNMTKEDVRIFFISRDLQECSDEEYDRFQKSLDNLRKNEKLSAILLSSRFKISFAPLRFILTFLAGLRVIKKNKIDLVYSRSFNCFLEAILCKILDVPLVIEINGLEPEEAELIKGKRSSIRKSLEDRIITFAFQYPIEVISVNEKIKIVLQEKYKISSNRIRVISNGADSSLFKPLDRGMSKKRVKLAEDARYICFVGQLMPWQGVENLIDAAPNIIENLPNARFIVVGDGQDKRMLMEMVNNMKLERYFHFTGAVPYEDVPSYINSSEVCVTLKKIISSGYSPLKLYEYMACGKPIVATRTTGFEILEHHDAGILVNSENPSEVASSIMRLLKDENLRESMGNNGRELVVEEYSWEGTAQNVLSVCEEAINAFNNERQ